MATMVLRGVPTISTIIPIVNSDDDSSVVRKSRSSGPEGSFQKRCEVGA
jgi:hypothetical protein